ncbi:MAG: hypothetical protein HYU36_04160 [Planctomycetes bacterium]|nr:hypothetical protein [Planctomycetota bacterium]
MLAGLVLAQPGSAGLAEGILVDILSASERAPLCEDPDSKSGKAVAGNFDLPRGTLLRALCPSLQPGFYLARIRLKLTEIATLQSSRQSVNLSIRDDGGQALFSRGFSILHFEASGQYQEFALPFRLDAYCEPVLEVSWEWTGRKQVPPVLRPGQVPDAESVAQNLAEEQDKSEEKDLGVDLEIPVKIGSLQHAALIADQASIDRLGDLGFVRVEADRIRYRPGETARIAVALHHAGPDVRSAHIRTLLLGGLYEARGLDARDLSLAPGQTAEFELQARLDGCLWGYEVRCVAELDGTEAARASEFFTVHDNPWAVSLGAQTINSTRGITPASAVQAASERKRSYGNRVEFVFWAPDDFGHLTPDTDLFYGGQMHFHGNVSGTRAAIQAFHQAGIFTSLYTKLWEPGPGGKAGYELIRQNPDWFATGFYDVAQLDRWDTDDTLMAWPQADVRRDIDEPFQHHASELVRSIQAFEWDAARYDSPMDRPEAARVLRLVKETVNHAFPAFQWGYNVTAYKMLEFPETFSLLCENGGMIMEEYNLAAPDQGWTWDYYTGRHRSIRSWVRERGGHGELISFGENFSLSDEEVPRIDLVYQDIFTLAAQLHWAYRQSSTLYYAHYPRFATRFAGFLWDNRSEPLKNPRDRIDLGEHSEHFFAWPEYAYLRQPEPGRRQLIFHLINAPASTRVGEAKHCPVPPPRSRIPLSIRIPPKTQVRGAWAATAEPELALDRLEVQTEKDSVRFTVPRVRFWTLVVVDIDGEEPWN